MKSQFWKAIGALLVGLPVGCYTAFVAECLWNWFAVPALHLSEISFLQMLGILLLIQVLIGQSSEDQDKRWEWLASVVGLCAPDEKRQALEEMTEKTLRVDFVEGFFLVFAKVGVNTFMLALGFVLHLIVA